MFHCFLFAADPGKGYTRGFQPMGHGPVVGHGAVFSGPQSLTRKQHQHSQIMSLRLLRAF